MSRAKRAACIVAFAATIEKLSGAEQKAVLDAAKTAEDRGWRMSIEEKSIKTQALKDAGIKVITPTAELKAGLAKIGETIAVEWAAAAGAEGKAMLEAYRK